MLSSISTVIPTPPILLVACLSTGGRLWSPWRMWWTCRWVQSSLLVGSSHHHCQSQMSDWHRSELKILLNWICIKTISHGVNGSLYRNGGDLYFAAHRGAITSKFSTLQVGPSPLNKGVADQNESSIAHTRSWQDSFPSDAHLCPTSTAAYVGVVLLKKQILTHFATFCALLGFWQNFGFLIYVIKLLVQAWNINASDNFFTWRNSTWDFKSGIFLSNFPRLIFLFFRNLGILS